MSLSLEIEHPFGRSLRARRYRLPSGLRVIVLPDRAVPIVSYQTWFRVGSRHERRGATGMAHLFEHLMFNRTESLSPGEIDRLIEATGGDSNAATWVDWTHYRCSVPAAELELVARLEADRMQHLVLDATSLESEREVVINERLEHVDDDVDGFLDEELHRLAFRVHPYHCPTIGWMEDIKALALPAVRDFYRTYYAPNNACIVIVGDVSERDALAVVERHYGHISASEVPAEHSVAEPPQTEARRAEFAKPVSAPRLALAYRVPGQAHADRPALELIAALLALGPSSRLYRSLVIEHELASSLDVSVEPFRDPCLFRASVSAMRDVDPERIEEAIASEIARLTSDVGQPELDKAKNVVETDLWSNLESVDGKGEALGHYETTLGDFRELFALADRIRGVTRDDVVRCVESYLRPDASTAVVAIPEDEP